VYIYVVARKLEDVNKFTQSTFCFACVPSKDKSVPFEITTLVFVLFCACAPVRVCYFASLSST
jgi:hypothetical protein